MTAAHKGKPPPDMQLTQEDVDRIDVLRLAEKYGTAPQDIEGWPLEWVNTAIELYAAESKIAKLPRH